MDPMPGPMMSARTHAAARSRHQQYHRGSGPTILSAVTCSHRSVDMEFVAAAARGDLSEVVRLLPQVSHVDVRTRGKARPMSALHLAAAFGSVEVVGVLLDAGADPVSRMEWLRSLTPLHLATSVAVAERLLVAGAQPIALDPREPDPSWYQRQQGRGDVADAIITARVNARLVSSAHAHAPSAAAPPNPSPAVASKRSVIPSLTAADVGLVRECWGCTAEALEVAAKVTRAEQPTRRLPSARVLSAADEETEAAPATTWRLPLRPNGGAVARSACEDEDGANAPQEHPGTRECAVCMGELEPALMDPPLRSRATSPHEPSLILLPCGMSSATPHAFHADCLERWLLVKATCPTCRTDVRPLLRQHLQQRQQQLQPPLPPPQSSQVLGTQSATASAAHMPTTRSRPANTLATQRTQRTLSSSPRGRPYKPLKQLIAPAPLEPQPPLGHATDGHMEAVPGSLPGSPRVGMDASSSSISRRCHTAWGGNGHVVSPMLPHVPALATLGRNPSPRSTPRAIVGSDIGWVPTGSLWAAIRSS